MIQHIFDAVKYWVDTFDIDGQRLDVAYCLDKKFLKLLRQFTDTLKEDFFWWERRCMETISSGQMMKYAILSQITNAIMECIPALTA